MKLLCFQTKLWILKCEFEVNTSEEWRVGVRSLVHDTSGIEASVLELQNRDHEEWQTSQLFTWTYTNQTSCNIFGEWTKHMQTHIHKTHHGLDLGETIAFPFIMFYVPSHGTNIQMSFCLGTPRLEFRNKLGLSQLWRPITLWTFN